MSSSCSALDNVLADDGPGPTALPRGEIVYTPRDLRRDVAGRRSRAGPPTPTASSSTPTDPLRIESMFPLGESGEVLPDAYGQADINPHFFSMIPVFDPFMPRPFPLFD